nr:HNH/endonuclease VII fold putative polymorphic toxin [Streptomyces sp. A1277]
MDENHQPIYYREEVYEHPNGNDLIVYQDHWFGHQKPGGPGYQPAHVRVRPFENTRNGQVPGARNIITMNARLSPRNSEVLAPLYGPAPLDLSSVRLRSVHLDWHGPTVTLRLDLPAPPLPLPEEWAAAGVDTVQGQLQFLAVEDLELDAWEPGPLVSFELAVLSESRHRIRVAVSQAGSPTSSASPAVPMCSSAASADSGSARKARTAGLTTFAADSTPSSTPLFPTRARRPSMNASEDLL